MNAEGGSSNFAFNTRASHSALSSAVRLVRGSRRPRTDFFLRAESLFNAATYLEELKDDVGASGRAWIRSPPTAGARCTSSRTESRSWR